MTSLKSLAPLRRKRVALALHMLVACAVMLSFAAQPDIMVRAIGVVATNVYLFFVAILTVRRVRREAAVVVPVAA